MTTPNVLKKMEKTIILASPRGFCAGVDRAIKIVEVALEKFGRPVSVRHEIVHNKRVVNDLASKGAIFVKELDEVPSGSPVIFSAHGVAKTVHQTAKKLNMIAIDATCPLVTKVHIEANKHVRQGRHIFLIGHAGHPEVIGTMGQVEASPLLKQLKTRLPSSHQKIAILLLQPRPHYQLMKQQKLLLFCSTVFLRSEDQKERISVTPRPTVRTQLKPWQRMLIYVL